MTVDKRTAVLTGARTVFARDGYTRASIDVIAAEAQVSTRTIYNHFRDKAGLFASVIETSAAGVAAAQLALIDRHLGTVDDLEKDLVAFGIAWRTPIPDHVEHSALVRQINAETGHIPAEVIETWQQTGPLAVRRALADRFEAFAADGLLTLDDPLRAALHFSALISGTDPSYRSRTPEEELSETVTSGVHAFLHGYGR
ncbi:TetR/AcrR family transcriptional regulator [Kribbella sp. DT2]|uniref:TetR/AcrR family transcriptional regulator n=1 Tax=Kribbella sp. DT2 TaxID=3393427 RepID=UPI003CFAFED7